MREIIMATAPFDTLKFAKSLREIASITSEQAEGFTVALADAFQDQLVTKSDLKIALLELENRLTVKMGAGAAAIIGVIAAFKFL